MGRTRFQQTAQTQHKRHLVSLVQDLVESPLNAAQLLLYPGQALSQPILTGGQGSKELTRKVTKTLPAGKRTDQPLHPVLPDKNSDRRQRLHDPHTTARHRPNTSRITEPGLAGQRRSATYRRPAGTAPSAEAFTGCSAGRPPK
ncbi:hypothetical protein GCM10029978_011750 [Actinoallomurus acanthiterrae]